MRTHIVSVFLLSLGATSAGATEPLQTAGTSFQHVAQAQAIRFVSAQSGKATSGDKSQAKRKGQSNESSDKGKEAIRKRVDELFKPLSTIHIAPASGDQKSPEDKAASHREAASLYISSAYHPTRGKNRYPHSFYHNPLYFEEPNLERCGNTCGCASTVVSAAHFLSNTIVLPYRMTAKPPWCCERTLGDCRSCEEMPCLRPLQCDFKAAIAEGAVAAGFVFLLL